MSLLSIQADGLFRHLSWAALGAARPLLQDIAVVKGTPSQGLRRPVRSAALGLAAGKQADGPGSEINAMLSLFPGSPRPARGARATLAGLKRLLAEDATVLHLGTHGLANAADPSRSRLQLRGAPGAVSMAELVACGTAKYDLVVLAACAMAQPGGPHAGGASEALVANGGACAGMSALWPVDGASTARIMTDFYSAPASPDDLTLAECLRRGQDAERARRPHPFYWAAWTVAVR